MMNSRDFERKILDNRNNLKQFVIQEGITEGLLGDFVQWLAGSAAEYGITIATAGTGAPAGIAAETFIDALFATKAIQGTVDAVEKISAETEEIKALIKKGMELSTTLRSNFEQFYEDIKSLLAKLMSKIGDKGKDKAKEIQEKIKKGIEKLVSKFVDAVVKAVKVLIPDETIGTAVGSTLRVAAETAASNSYTVASKALEKAEKFKDFLLKPGVAANFFKDLAKSLVELLETFKEKIESTSTTKALAVGGATGNPALALAVKKLGPSGIEKLIGLIKENLPNLLSLVDKIVQFVIPGFFVSIAIYQSLEKEDYKSEEKKEKSDNKEETKKEAYIRSFVLECLSENQKISKNKRKRLIIDSL